jgi:hypothetical protein
VGRVTSESSVPRPFAFLTVALSIAAVSSLVLSLLRPWPETWILVVVMAVIALLSENFAPVIGGYSASLAMPIAVIAMLLYGPVAAALVSGVSALNKRSFASLRNTTLTFFNMGQLVIVSLAAGWTYALLGGPLMSAGEPLSGSNFGQWLLPIVALAVVAAVGNVLMLSVGMSALYGSGLRDAFASTIMHVPSSMALVGVGLLMAQVTATSRISLVFFIFPLFVARDLYQRFKSLKDAYADTIRSLIHALEAKDPYTRGHSERVAKYAVTIGHAMDLDAKSCERLEYAGLLHDLGKIALPKSLLIKSGVLTDEEMALMRDHPAAGAAMVARIPPLTELAELVLEHHERYEGGGYPFGMDAKRTGLLSRVLTVADAYDAMTSNRAYRDAMSCERAQTILVEASGTQFDPLIVDAFRSTWSRQADARMENTEAACGNQDSPATVPSCLIEGAGGA